MQSIKRFILTFLVMAAPLSAKDPDSKSFARTSAYEMKPGDEVRIDYTSRGCFHWAHHELVLTRTEKGVSLTGANLQFPADEKTNKPVEGEKKKWRSVDLTEDQLARIDRTFEYLRNCGRGGCTTVNNITLTQTRAGKTIASESMVDATCHLGSDGKTISFAELIALICPKTDP